MTSGECITSGSRAAPPSLGRIVGGEVLDVEPGDGELLAAAEWHRRGADVDAGVGGVSGSNL